MSKLDISQLLNEPIFAFDFHFMVGDVADFLDLSESNLEWLHRRELLSIEHRAAREDFPPGYRNHLEANAQHRFNVSLPLRVRYGALVALITSVEWSVKNLVDRLSEPIAETPNKVNETVHALRWLDEKVQTREVDTINDYEALVHMRNCIAHNAGIERGSKWSGELPSAVSRLKGFSIDKWHVFGRHICIEKGALTTYVERLNRLVVALYRGAHERGLLRST